MMLIKMTATQKQAHKDVGGPTNNLNPNGIEL